MLKSISCDVKLPVWQQTAAAGIIAVAQTAELSLDETVAYDALQKLCKEADTFTLQAGSGDETTLSLKVTMMGDGAMIVLLLHDSKSNNVVVFDFLSSATPNIHAFIELAASRIQASKRETRDFPQRQPSASSVTFGVSSIPQPATRERFGETDIQPSGGSGGFSRSGAPVGAGAVTNGGNYFGPNHPMFAGIRGGRDIAGMYARFDPPFPGGSLPLHPDGRQLGVPDPDHLRPMNNDLQRGGGGFSFGRGRGGFNYGW